jgi:hypothetical protein
LAFFFLVFFFLVFCSGAFCAEEVWAACVDDSVDAGVASAAQAGATIKANSNSNMFFMMIPFCG